MADDETTIRVGMGQMLVQGGELECNLTRAAAMIKDAATQDCDIVVLPECLDVGWTHPSALALAESIPGKTCDVLCQIAVDAGIHIVAGLTERAGDLVFNAAVIIADDGRVLLKHRKINVLRIAQDLYVTGNQLSVAETSFGTIGVNICADNFPSSLEVGHVLARMGAQCLLSPCAWAVDADFDNDLTPYGDDLWKPAYKNLAMSYDMPVIGVSNVGTLSAGPWKGRRCIGNSLAIDGNGHVLAEAAFGENAQCLHVVDLRLTPRSVTGTSLSDKVHRQAHKSL